MNLLHSLILLTKESSTLLTLYRNNNPFLHVDLYLFLPYQSHYLLLKKWNRYPQKRMDSNLLCHHTSNNMPIDAPNQSLIKFPLDHCETTHHDVYKELEKAQVSSSPPTMGIIKHWIHKPTSSILPPLVSHHHHNTHSRHWLATNFSLLNLFYSLLSTTHTMHSNHSPFKYEEKQVVCGRAQHLIM